MPAKPRPTLIDLPRVSGIRIFGQIFSLAARFI
jgi:hypothetical protein